MNSTHILKKIYSCLVAALTVSALVLVLGNSGTISWLPAIYIFSSIIILLITSLIFPFIWHHREKSGEINSMRINKLLNQSIIYALAINLATFGFKKIVGLQFIVPEDVAIRPMNQQSGEWLTWFYFGYSKPFATLLALIQIIGAYLLFYRKTQLFATLLLLAFMVNLTLINIFYGLNLGATLQSILITIGLTYILLLYSRPLIHAIFNSNVEIAGFKKSNTFNLFSLLAIIFSISFVLYLKYLG
ncbi:hypothetical protein ACFRAE_10440 [Sphingobacterium sp. HJSM2_6]|uniref:hypothetical protein n=1 Tax=Sphingobacterium sp. HJSM2_6 TaxID=3366264 RepID=UPI003BEEA4B6